MPPTYRGQIGSAIWAQNTGVAPTNDAIGVNGDFTLDVSNWFVYGPKTNNTWSGVTTRHLARGVNITFASANVAPSFTPTGGEPGDVYFTLDTSSTFNCWVNTSGTWTNALSFSLPVAPGSGGGAGGGDGSM